jgi:hypothetical protein
MIPRELAERASLRVCSVVAPIERLPLFHLDLRILEVRLSRDHLEHTIETTVDSSFVNLAGQAAAGQAFSARTESASLITGAGSLPIHVAYHVA